MKVSLTWEDLLKLGANGRVETSDYTLEVVRPVLVHLTSHEGSQAVAFTLDESDPKSREAGTQPESITITLAAPLAERFQKHMDEAKG